MLVRIQLLTVSHKNHVPYPYLTWNYIVHVSKVLWERAWRNLSIICQCSVNKCLCVGKLICALAIKNPLVHVCYMKLFKSKYRVWNTFDSYSRLRCPCTLTSKQLRINVFHHYNSTIPFASIVVYTWICSHRHIHENQLWHSWCLSNRYLNKQTSIQSLFWVT